MLSHIELGDHVCWQVGHDRPWLRDVAAFVRDGVAAEDQVVFLTSAHTPHQVRSEFAEQGLDVDTLVRTGRLEIADAETAFCPGSQDGHTRIDRWRQRCARLRAEGYHGVRVIADRRWAADWIHDLTATGTGPADVERLHALVEYETAITTAITDGYAATVCIYPTRSFTRATMQALTSVHPGTLTPHTPPRTEPLLRIRWSSPLRLRLDGECDLSNQAATVAALTALAHAARAAGRPATLDASRLHFTDGATARILLAAGAATPAGLTIEDGSDHLRAVLHLTRDRRTHDQ